MGAPRTLRMTGSVKRAVVAHAQRAAPLECCGFLIGRDDDVFCSVEMDNAEASPVRYRIADEEHLELRRMLRRATPPLVILGVYHSHPAGDAQLSPTDIAQAYYADWVQLVVGLGGHQPVVRAFAVTDGLVRPVTLR